MKKLVISTIFCVFLVQGSTFGQSSGLISGTASVDGKPLANITVRLRDVTNGQLVGNTNAATSGEYSFSGLTPGNYVVEMVSAEGTIIGTSVTVTLTAAVMVSTNVTVSASAAAIAAAGGTGAVGGAIGAGVATGAGAAAGTAATAGAVAGAAAAGAAGLSATVIAVSAVGVALGTTAVVAVANDASPSR